MFRPNYLNSADLNTIEPGFYYIISPTHGASSYCVYWCISMDGRHKAQLGFGTKAYYREYNANTQSWTEWEIL